MLYTIKYLQLAWLIFKHGRLKHSEEDFNKNREESLKELQDFIPNRSIQKVISTSCLKNSGTRNLIIQASFVKNSFRTIGGHLAVSNISYIRIPKAASTSMCKELLDKMYPSLNQKNITETQINFLTDVNLQTEVLNPSILFTIVRNPFSRLVSVYRDFFENAAHYIYRDHLFGILPPQLSFSEFVERLACIPDRLKDIRPQHTFLKYYEQKGFEVKVLRLEDLEQLSEFLNQYNMSLPHINRSTEPYDYRSYYDMATLDTVCKIYNVDIERFGYQMAEKELIEYIKTVH